MYGVEVESWIIDKLDDSLQPVALGLVGQNEAPQCDPPCFFLMVHTSVYGLNYGKCFLSLALEFSMLTYGNFREGFSTA